ncbi:MAG: pantoate--beta-alanine ligase, partial [Bacteroidota bacterium]
FDGVAQVVSRLLEIVQPTTLLLGQKDYQQVAIVRSMIQQLELPVKLEVVPTVREDNGLAMSSRNQRLNPQERQAAAEINRHLAAVVAGLEAGWPVRSLEELALSEIAKHPLLEPEYLEVAHGDTLLPFAEGDATEEIVVATAVHCGPVRLIDNMVVKRVV